MQTEIHIYYEGAPELKEGFTAFFEELKLRAGGKFRLRSSGSNAEAQRDFGIAIRQNPRVWNILLLDSEGPVSSRSSSLLCRKQGWDPSHAGSIFWMAEMMESWFHADKPALKNFYGHRFKEQSLKRNPKVEQIPKKDLIDGLRRATKNTDKGEYHKTFHGRKLLGLIDSERVQKAAPNCKKLFMTVLERVEHGPAPKPRRLPIR